MIQDKRTQIKTGAEIDNCTTAKEVALVLSKALSPDIKIKLRDDFYGYYFTPITQAGKDFCQKYKGVVMKEFSVSIALYSGVVESILRCGLVTEEEL